MDLLKYRFRTLYKYKDLIYDLVVRDLKLKYRRSVLGYLWTILNPLLIMIVMTVVFSTMFNRHVENYPVYLLTGRTLYDFLKQSTTQGMKSVEKNASLLKKVYIPKYIFTFAQVTSCLVDSLLAIGALLIVMVVTRAAFHWQMILFPFVYLQIYVFCMGLAFLLAELNVFFKDVQYIYSAVMTAWLYLTPILYPIERMEKLPALQYAILHFNPLTYYIRQYRCLVYEGRLPGARLVLGGICIAVSMLIIGVYFFQKNKDRFILYL